MQSHDTDNNKDLWKRLPVQMQFCLFSLAIPWNDKRDIGHTQLVYKKDSGHVRLEILTLLKVLIMGNTTHFQAVLALLMIPVTKFTPLVTLQFLGDTHGKDWDSR
jgi:hypothetical protein